MPLGEALACFYQIFGQTDRAQRRGKGRAITRHGVVVGHRRDLALRSCALENQIEAAIDKIAVVARCRYEFVEGHAVATATVLRPARDQVARPVPETVDEMQCVAGERLAQPLHLVFAKRRDHFPGKDQGVSADALGLLNKGGGFARQARVLSEVESGAMLMVRAGIAEPRIDQLGAAFSEEALERSRPGLMHPAVQNDPHQPAPFMFFGCARLTTGSPDLQQAVARRACFSAVRSSRWDYTSRCARKNHRVGCPTYSGRRDAPENPRPHD